MNVIPIRLLIISYLLLFQSTVIVNAGDRTFKKDTLSPDTLTIVGVGDIMMGSNFPSKRYLHPGGCEHFFKGVDQFLVDADLTTGNLEGCLSDDAELVKRCKDTTNCYAFRMPLKYADCLQANGFDVMSIANNHSHDFGIEGVRHTTDVLDSMEIGYAGTPEHPYHIFKDSNNITYGFCAFAPNKGTLSITDYTKAKEIVGFLNDTCDVVIVSFHGGAEGSKHRNVTRKTEYYFNEDRGNVYEFARQVIDSGADIVFGHGPHVSRAIDIYKNRLICYSLGNFITYGRFNLRGPNGIAPIVKAHLSKQGEFITGRIIPVKQYYSGKLIVDPQKRAIEEIQQLTKTDFPNAAVHITEDGLILKKN